MTGLDPSVDVILEAAVVVTDGALTTAVQGPSVVIHHDDVTLASMNPWSAAQHAQTGLTDLSRDSTVTLAEAEDQILAFLERLIQVPHVAPLAGNSVHVDRAFLRKYMPRVTEYLHSHWLIDVTTVAQLTKRWSSAKFSARPPKVGNHRALGDIMESIHELRYYQNCVWGRGRGQDLCVGQYTQDAEPSKDQRREATEETVEVEKERCRG